jgi:hypothetical protein
MVSPKGEAYLSLRVGVRLGIYGILYIPWDLSGMNFQNKNTINTRSRDYMDVYNTTYIGKLTLFGWWYLWWYDYLELFSLITRNGSNKGLFSQ